MSSEVSKDEAWVLLELWTCSHTLVRATWETRYVMSGGFWRQWINSAWWGILKDTISPTSWGNKLKINLYVPSSAGKYPEGCVLLFTNQKKLHCRYHKTRESLSGSALDPDKLLACSPTYMSIINVRDEHTGKNFISQATALEIYTDQVLFIKNKHYILIWHTRAQMQ